MKIFIVQQKPRHWYLKTHISISRTMVNVIHIFSKCVQNIILFFILKLLLPQKPFKVEAHEPQFTIIPRARHFSINFC